MTHVLIHHCRVRVVRRGGWSWGPDPARLRDDVLRLLPQLIEHSLPGMDCANADAEIAAPIRATIRLRLNQAGRLDRPTERSGTLETDMGIRGAAEPIRSAIAASLRSVVITGAPTPPATVRRRGDQPADDGPHAASITESEGPSAEVADELTDHEWPALMRYLISHPAPRRLIALIPPALLCRLVHWLRATAPRNDIISSGTDLQESVARVVAPAPVGPSPFTDDLPDVAADRLHLLRTVELALATGNDTPEPTIQPPLLDRPAPPPGVRTPTPADRDAPPRRFSPQQDLHKVTHALPFLLLAPLFRRGVFRLLCASLHQDLLPAHALAQLLAFKVLPPPARGWRRDPHHLDAAAVFAGLESPLTDPQLSSMALELAGIAHLLCLHALAHRPKDHSPEVLVAFMLADPSAVSLHAWPTLEPLLDTSFSPTAQSLRAAAAGIPVLIPAQARSAAVALADAGVPIICEADPRPVLELRRVHRARAWTNADVAAAARWAPALAEGGERTESLWRQLHTARPALPLHPQVILERSLTTLMCTALADIAIALWPGDPRPDPLLVLDRFGDLDAAVDTTDEAVRVRLPLGRRRSDLARAGLLRDVKGLPWWGGREVQFLGGS